MSALVATLVTVGLMTNAMNAKARELGFLSMQRQRIDVFAGDQVGEQSGCRIRPG